MTHAIRGGLLLLLAGLIVRLLVTGQMRLYMSPALDPLGGATAAVVAGMGAIELWSAVRARRPRPGFAHAHGPPATALDQALTYLLVAVPIAIGFLVTPRALDSSALGGLDAARAVVAFSPTPATVELVPPTSPIDDVGPLFHYLRVAGEAGVGQPVHLLGLVARDRSLADNQFVLLRYTIVHCVADAQPIGLLVDVPPELASTLEGGGWVAIDGELAATPSDRAHLVSVHARAVVATDEPADPYLWNL